MEKGSISLLKFGLPTQDADSQGDDAQDADIQGDDNWAADTQDTENQGSDAYGSYIDVDETCAAAF